MRPSAAAVTASSPSNAPVGTMICPPRALASSINSGRGNSAPAESTITCFPASSIGRQIRSSTEAGAHSTARSASAGNASGSTKGHAICSASSQARALAWSRAAAQASVRPGTPAESLRASTRPMAPRPATAMRVIGIRGPWAWCELQQLASYADRSSVTSPCEPRVKQRLDRRLAEGQILRAMRRSQMLKTIFGMACGVLLAVSGTALAQTYPARPMTMIIPFAAGGPTDVLGRVVAQRMGDILGQQVVVENVGGAGGMTGSKRVADAAPDGYTFVLGTVGTHAQGQTLYKRPLYNAAADFTPVALIAEVPIILIVRKDLPPNNLHDFVTYTKANQAKMQFGSAGAGSATHLGCVLLNYVIGVDVTHVPYRGTGPAMQDLQGGRIDYLCEIITTAKPQIDGGTVKGLAILDSKRSPALPDLPTAAEQGTENLVAYTWNAIFLPKGTPEPIVRKLHDAALEAMHTPSVRDRLEGLGARIVPDNEATPQYLGSFVKSEIDKWAAPIKASGVSVE